MSTSLHHSERTPNACLVSEKHAPKAMFTAAGATITEDSDTPNDGVGFTGDSFTLAIDAPSGAAGAVYTFYIDNNSDGMLDGGDTVLQSGSMTSYVGDFGTANFPEGATVIVSFEDDNGTVADETDDITGCSIGIYTSCIVVSTTNISNESCFGMPDDGFISIVVSGGSAPYSYDWSDGTANDQTNTGSFSTASNLEGSTTGISYTVIVTDASGCTGSLTTSITEPDELDPIMISGQEDICAFSQEVIYDIPATAGSNYIWTITNGDLIFGQGTASIRVNWQNMNGTVEVTEITAEGCERMADLDITVFNPTVTVNGPTTACQNDLVDPVFTGSPLPTAMATGVFAIIPSSGVIVDNGDGTATIDVSDTDPGQYAITYTYSENGCDFTAGAMIEVIAPLIASVEDYLEQCITLPSMFDLTNMVNGGTSDGSFSVDGTTTIPVVDGSAFFNVSAPGCYDIEFTVVDPNCGTSMSTASLLVTQQPEPTLMIAAAGNSPLCNVGSLTVTPTAMASVTGSTLELTSSLNGSAEVTAINGGAFVIPAPPSPGTNTVQFCITETIAVPAMCGGIDPTDTDVFFACTSTVCELFTIYNDGQDCSASAFDCCEDDIPPLEPCYIETDPALALKCGNLFQIFGPEILDPSVQANSSVIFCGDESVCIDTDVEFNGLLSGAAGGPTIGSLPGADVVCEILTFEICTPKIEISIPFVGSICLIPAFCVEPLDPVIPDQITDFCEQPIGELVVDVLATLAGNDGGGGYVVADTDGDGTLDYMVATYDGISQSNGLNGAKVPNNLEGSGYITIRHVMGWPGKPTDWCGKPTEAEQNLLDLLPIGSIPLIGGPIEDLLGTLQCNVELGFSDEQTIQVQVLNNTPPAFTNCNDLGYVFTEDGVCDTEVNWSVPVAYDGCEGTLLDYKGFTATADASFYTGTGTPTPVTIDEGGVFQTAGPIPGSDIAPGVYSITYTAYSCCGYTSECTFPLVVEAGDPMLACPPNLVVNTNVDECTSVVTGLEPIQGVHCLSTINYEITGATIVNATTSTTPGEHNIPNGTVFELGTSTIIYTMTIDINGDGDVMDTNETQTCSFTVIVEDDQRPVAVCQDLTIQLDNTGNATIVATDVDGGSFDNCPTVDLSITPNTFDCTDIGDNPVTLTVTDAAGNVSYCLATVTVLDYFEDWDIELDVPELCLESNNPEQLDFSNYINVTLPDGTIIASEEIVNTYLGDVTAGFGITAFAPHVGSTSIDPGSITSEGIYTPGDGTGYITISYIVALQNAPLFQNGNIAYGDQCYRIEHSTFELFQPLDVSDAVCNCPNDEGIREVNLGDLLAAGSNFDGAYETDIVPNGQGPYTLQYTGGTLFSAAGSAGTQLDVNENGIVVFDYMYTSNNGTGMVLDDDGTAIIALETGELDAPNTSGNTNSGIFDLGTLVLDEGVNDWSFTLVDARGCELFRSGTCANLDLDLLGPSGPICINQLSATYIDPRVEPNLVGNSGSLSGVPTCETVAGGANFDPTWELVVMSPNGLLPIDAVSGGTIYPNAFASNQGILTAVNSLGATINTAHGTVNLNPSALEALGLLGDELILRYYIDRSQCYDGDDLQEELACVDFFEIPVTILPEIEPTFELPSTVCISQTFSSSTAIGQGQFLLSPDDINKLVAYVNMTDIDDDGNPMNDDTVEDYITWYSQNSSSTPNDGQPNDNGIIDFSADDNGLAIFDFAQAGEGTFNVCLEIGAAGCANTFCQAITVIEDVSALIENKDVCISPSGQVDLSLMLVDEAFSDQTVGGDFDVFSATGVTLTNPNPNVPGTELSVYGTNLAAPGIDLTIDGDELQYNPYGQAPYNALVCYAVGIIPVQEYAGADGLLNNISDGSANPVITTGAADNEFGFDGDNDGLVTLGNPQDIPATADLNNDKEFDKNEITQHYLANFGGPLGGLTNVADMQTAAAAYQAYLNALLINYNCFDMHVAILTISEGYSVTLDVPEICLEDNNPSQYDLTNYVTIYDASGNIVEPDDVQANNPVGQWSIVQWEPYAGQNLYDTPNDSDDGNVLSDGLGSFDAGYINRTTGAYTPGGGTGHVSVRYELIFDNDAGYDCEAIAEDIIELRQALDMGIPYCECDLPTPQESYLKVDLGAISNGLEPYTIQFEGAGLDLNSDGIPDVVYDRGSYVYNVENGHNIDDFTEDLGELIINNDETNWSFTIVDARGCELQRQGQCDPLLDVPYWVGSNSPVCFTDGTFDISLNNSFDITADYLDGNPDNGNIIITKLRNALVDADKCENHAGFNADTGFTDVFVRDAEEDRITVNPESLIGDDFRYAGTYMITLVIAPAENTECQTILVEQEITLYPSFNACFEAPVEPCGNGDLLRIDIESYNPGYDHLADDLLCRDLDEMSVWELIAPSGTAIGTGTLSQLVQENDADADGNIYIEGMADGDVIIDAVALYNTFGPGLYTLNHEMGIDICKTSCSQAFELYDFARVTASTNMPVVCCADSLTLVVDSIYGGTQFYSYQWSENLTGYESELVTYPDAEVFETEFAVSDTLMVGVEDLPGGCPMFDTDSTTVVQDRVYEFVLTVIDAKGCLFRDTVFVAINPNSETEPEVINAIYCQTNKAGEEAPIKPTIYSSSTLKVNCGESFDNVDFDGDGFIDYGVCGGIAVVPDSDGDGIPDVADSDLDGIDSDGDGVPDLADVDILCIDEDGDGIPDLADMDFPLTAMDMDNDGIPDAADVDSDGDGNLDVQYDTDGDGIPDVCDIDVDGDGIYDGIMDADGDNIPDDIDTDFGALDSDNDGICDAADVDQLGGLDSDGDGIADIADVDDDNDGINDAADFDDDGDGFMDAQYDADGDNIEDIADVSTYATATDTDGDGIFDEADFDQTPGIDTDGDGILDFQDWDDDNDGIVDFADADNNGNDADGDGINDEFDVDMDGNGFTNAPDVDTDNDGILDAFDCDDDNDGIYDFGDADVGGDGLIDFNILDADGDNLIDGLDPDIDNDGIINTCDADANGDNIDDNSPDSDDDGINDIGDVDADDDCIEDSCDADVDGDGILDNGVDTDGDGVIDACDLDDDDDGITDVCDADINGDGIIDNGIDTDGDGITDACDNDDDNDEVIDFCDSGQFDTDGDAIIDAIDADIQGNDTDGDGITDFADADVDGDGIPNCIDADANGTDNDNDGINDAGDLDDDNDGILDAYDHNPFFAFDNTDADNDEISDACDVDQTGGLDANMNGIDDACEMTVIDANGDGYDDILFVCEDNNLDGIIDYIVSADDADSDGVLDSCDVDADNDGINDTCDIDQNPTATDSDGDGIIDSCDEVIYPFPTAGWFATATSDTLLYDADLDKDGVFESDLDDDSSTFDPVAAGLVDPNEPGVYTFWVECYCVPDMKCVSPRVPVTLTILDCQADQGECTYLLVLKDLGLDGWDGASIDVSIDEGPATNYKVTPEDCDLKIIPITTGDGGLIDLTYWNGAKENEHKWCLFAPDGSIALDNNGVEVDLGAFPPAGETFRVKLDCPVNCEDTEEYYIVNTVGSSATAQIWELRDDTGQLIEFAAFGDYEGLALGTLVIDTVMLNTCTDYTFTTLDGTGTIWTDATWQIIGTDSDRGTLITANGTFKGFQEIVAGPVSAIDEEQICTFTIPCKPTDCPDDISEVTLNTLDCEFSGFVHPNPPTPFVCYPNCNHANPGPITTISYPTLGVDKVDVSTAVVLASGENPVVFEITYTDGQIVRCSSTVHVVTDSNPAFACNDLVYISLVNTTLSDPDDCYVTVDPDDVLEATLPCADQYRVIIFDENGQALVPPNVVGPEQAGQTLVYNVQHVGFAENVCWGNLVVEDKIAPIIECSDYNIECSHPELENEFYIRNETYPANVLPDNIAGDTGSNIEKNIIVDCAPEGELIHSLNLEVVHNHNRPSDLIISILSPSGQSITSGFPIDQSLFDVFNETPFNTHRGTWEVVITDTNGTVINNDLGGAGSVLEINLNVTAGFPTPVIGADCSAISLEVIDEQIVETDCDQSEWLGAVLVRTWQAIDVFGNSSTCTQNIGLLAPTMDDIEKPLDIALECGSVPINPDEIVPSISGGPLFGCFTLDESLHGLCDISYTYEDELIPSCGVGFKIIRTWTIINWCSSVNVTHEQSISVEDTTPPTINMSDIEFNSSATDCTSGSILINPAVTDNCSGITELKVSYIENGGAYDAAGTLVVQDILNGESINNLDFGVTELLVTATDSCGNTTQQLIDVNITDGIAPVVICNDELHVSLGSTGSARLFATDIDEGSYDNCGISAIEVRRTDGCLGESDWNETVTFGCCDMDELITVELRVTDNSGNTNICWQQVLVEDALPPVITCPEDITLDCNDPSVHDPFGEATAIDNCTVSVSFEDGGALDQCKAGILTRTFTASDNSDKSPDISCIQRVTVNHVSDFVIQFPADISIATCPNEISGTGEPIISDEDCEMIAISSEDLILAAVEGACFKIERTWTVVNWCIYNEGATDNTALGIPMPLPRTYRDDDGYFQYVQIIDVLDNTPPTVDNPGNIEFCDTTNDCEGIANLTVFPSDECSDYFLLEYTHIIDLYNDGTDDIIASGQDASGTYPYGIHSIKWTIEDGCGNATQMSHLFTIKDCKNPTPVCLNGISSPVMNSNGCVEVWASDLLEYAFDNCSSNEFVEASVRIRKLGDTTPPEASVTFCCTDSLGIQLVEVWVEDELGNADYCTTYVDVQDSSGQCDDDTVIIVDESKTIAGQIATRTNNMVENVLMSIHSSDGINDAMSTDESGEYAFTELTTTMNYTLTPTKNDDPLNGVTTFDLILISQHILGNNSLNGPYQMIAADINNDGNITTFDIIQARQLILFKIQDFPNNTSWRFIDAKYTFPMSSNPWMEAFPEVIDIQNLTQDEMTSDFIGIKIGDINGDALPNSLSTLNDRNEQEGIQLIINDQLLNEGETSSIDFLAKDFKQIKGFQFTLSFDPEQLDFVGSESEMLDLKDENLGWNLLDEGVIMVSWNSENAQSFADDAVLFSLGFKSKKQVTLRETIQINSRYTKAEAYTDTEIIPIGLSFNVSDDIDTPQLYQNVPNPFTHQTNINFYLPNSSTAKVSIMDITGRVLKTIERVFDKGEHQITILNKDIKASGVLYYQLDTPQFSISKKMIKLQ